MLKDYILIVKMGQLCGCVEKEKSSENTEKKQDIIQIRSFSSAQVNSDNSNRCMPDKFVSVHRKFKLEDRRSKSREE
jgi:hypothetical protein